MFIERTKIVDFPADCGLENMKVIGVANWSSNCFVELDDLCRPGKKRHKPQYLDFGQAEALNESRIVKNPFYFFKQGRRENQSMATIKNLEKKCPRQPCSQMIRPDQDSRVEGDSHRLDR